jgi:DNA-binding SARP family transcriptional activator
MRSITKTRKCQFFYEGFYFESPQAYAAWVKEQANAFIEAKIGFLKLRQVSIAA